MNPLNLERKRAPHIQAAALLFGLGALGLSSCSSEIQETSPTITTTTTSTPETTPTTIVIDLLRDDDRNCSFGPSTEMLGTEPESPQPVDVILERHLDNLSEEAGVDLTQCDLELIDVVLQNPANRTFGAAGPDSEVTTVYAPGVVTVNG